MKVLIGFSYLVAMTLAEAPISDSYFTGHPHQDQDSPNDFQRQQPSEDYGPPSSRSIAPSQEYGVPRSLNQNSGPPAPRSVSQEYGPPGFRNRLSQTYGPPGIRNSLPRQYGPPQNEQVLSNHMESYSVPINQGLSMEYAVSDARSFGPLHPSQEYGVPTANTLQRYASPDVGSQFGAKSSASRSYSRSLSKTYRPSKSGPNYFSSNTRSSNYLPSSRSSNGYPSQRISDAYGPPASSYGVPSKTLAVTSSFPSVRGPSPTYGVPKSSISDSYGPPAVEAKSGLSDQYGVPDQSGIGQGYNNDNARKALEELQNQEPANYDFSYKVEDFENGSDFGHTETRQDNKAEGSYFVLLPDGTKQTVEYEADESGFKPRISVETINNDAGAGYDQNASDIQSRNGPY